VKVNGSKLKQIRESKGLTQQALADAAELHVMTVSAIEREAERPTRSGPRGRHINTIAALARALDVTVDELLDKGVPATTP